MQLPHALINAKVFTRRNPPREILAHAVAHQLLPRTLIAIELQRLMNGSQQGFSGVFLELESGALLSACIPGIDRVVEAACSTNHRRGTVLQAVNLVQAARLVAGRHKKHVRAGLNLVGQCVVVSDSHSDLVGHASAEAHKHFLIEPVAAAEHGQQDVFERQPVHDLPDQVKTLLRGKARNDANHRRVFVSLIKPEAGKQVPLAFYFPAEILRRVVGGNEFVGLRVPLLIINPVQDSGHGLRPLLEHALKAETEFRRLNFLAVLSADRRDEVAVSQRPLQKVDVAEILHLRNREQVPGQHEQGEYLRRKQPLVSHVVNGEDRPGVPEGRVFDILGAKQHRDHGRLPIMAMKNIGHTENLRSFDHRPTKQGEALGIVRKIARGGAI